MAEISTPRPPSTRAGAVVWLVSLQILLLTSLVAWVALVGLSFMAFDAGTDIGALPWTLLILLWIWPLVALVSSVWAWVAFARRKTRKALVLMAFPFAFALATAALLGAAVVLS